MDKQLRKSSVERGKLYAKIRNKTLDFAEEINFILKGEQEIFGNVEMSISKSKAHVIKTTLCDKPLLELNREAHSGEDNV